MTPIVPVLRFIIADSMGMSFDVGGLALFNLEENTESSKNRGHGFRKILPNKIDYATLRNMIGYCEENHLSCRQFTRADIAGLRVIDCTTKRVVFAPLACEYVALSYVWGTQQSTSTTPLSRSTFPPAVEDSIKATVALEYRFLWVDRHVRTYSMHH